MVVSSYSSVSSALRLFTRSAPGAVMAMEWMKYPTMVIFWADTRELLSRSELQEMVQSCCAVVDFNPLEVLIEHPENGRLIAVRGVTDPAAPDALMPNVLGRA